MEIVATGDSEAGFETGGGMLDRAYFLIESSDHRVQPTRLGPEQPYAATPWASFQLFAERAALAPAMRPKITALPMAIPPPA